MKVSDLKEQYKKENTKEWCKLQWNIPFQLRRLWFRIEMWLSR